MCEPDPSFPQAALAVVVARPGPLRNSLQALLTTMVQIEIVAEADDASALLRLGDKVRPDIVILDSNPPEEDTRTALMRIRKAWPNARIIVLAEDSRQQRLAQEAGADVALLKGFPAAKLGATIESFLVGSAG